MWVFCSWGCSWYVASLLAGNCMDSWALYLLKSTWNGAYINILELSLCHPKYLTFCTLNFFYFLHSQWLIIWHYFSQQEKFTSWCNLSFCFFFKQQNQNAVYNSVGLTIIASCLWSSMKMRMSDCNSFLLIYMM